jgi:hypothetical protein
MVSSTQMGSGAVADIIAEINDAIEPGETIRRASVASLLVPLKSRYSVLLIISIAAALIRMSGSPKPLLLVTAPREPGIRRLLPMEYRTRSQRIPGSGMDCSGFLSLSMTTHSIGSTAC